MTAITEKEIELEIIAQVGITRNQNIVVYLMIMISLQTQCAAHAKVSFFDKLLHKIGSIPYILKKVR